jgi:hypothetical protein
MALGTSLFLIAAGAVLRFAVNVTTHGFNLHTVGVILMVVGGIGVVLSLLWMAVWSRESRGPAYVERRPSAYADRDVPPPYQP